jgi:hypothetical protein
VHKCWRATAWTTPGPPSTKSTNSKGEAARTPTVVLQYCGKRCLGNKEVPLRFLKFHYLDAPGESVQDRENSAQKVVKGPCLKVLARVVAQALLFGFFLRVLPGLLKLLSPPAVLTLRGLQGHGKI